MLTADQIRTVKLSWNSYRDVDPVLVGEVFFTKLFMEYPSLRTLFKNPLRQQYKKLVDMLNVMVARLDRQEEVMVLIEQLGSRHRGYGVKPEHYTAIGQVLLWTLKMGLGDRWTKEMETAWSVLYDMVAKAMIESKVNDSATAGKCGLFPD